MNELTKKTEESTDIATTTTDDLMVVRPLFDIYENDKELLLLADLPGVQSEDLELHFAKGELSIEARRKSSGLLGEVLAAELGGVLYRRAFAMPRDIDASGIEAKLNDGVLAIHVPRAAYSQARRIEVSAS